MTPTSEQTAEERADYKTINRTSLAPIERAELLTFGYLSGRGSPGGAEFGRVTSIQILAETIKEYDSLRLTNQRLEAEMADNGHNLFNLLSRVDELENLLNEAHARLKRLIPNDPHIAERIEEYFRFSGLHGEGEQE